MKKVIFSIVTLVVLGLNSCKKKEDLTVGLASEIQKIVPQVILDDVKSKGMVINEGRVPPSLEGIFIVTPFELLSPYSSQDSYSKGTVIDAYTYKFSGQSADKKSVVLDYKNVGSDRGAGIGSFVAGNGNKFTLFAEVKGTASGVSYTMLKIISGEITDKGIKNFQESLYMKDKSEGTGLGALIPVNTGRIWFDNDLMSGRGNSFRIGVNTKNKANKSDNSAVSNARP